MYKYDLGQRALMLLNTFVVVCVQSVTVYRDRVRVREREKEVVASIVTVVWRSRGARGRGLCASIIVTFSHSYYSAVCGLPWFFPRLLGSPRKHSVCPLFHLLITVFCAYTDYSVVAECIEANRIPFRPSIVKPHLKPSLPCKDETH